MKCKLGNLLKSHFSLCNLPQLVITRHIHGQTQSVAQQAEESNADTDAENILLRHC